MGLTRTTYISLFARRIIQAEFYLLAFTARFYSPAHFVTEADAGSPAFHRTVIRTFPAADDLIIIGQRSCFRQSDVVKRRLAGSGLDLNRMSPGQTTEINRTADRIVTSLTAVFISSSEFQRYLRAVKLKNNSGTSHTRRVTTTPFENSSSYAFIQPESCIFSDVSAFDEFPEIYCTGVHFLINKLSIKSADF